MAQCLKKTDEFGKEGLLRDGVHNGQIIRILEKFAKLNEKELAVAIFLADEVLNQQ